MSGKRAKALRKTIYGDQSIRKKRTYGWEVVNHQGRAYSGGLCNTGLRKHYQEMKRELVRNHHYNLG
jgi:hypothetical protein